MMFEPHTIKDVAALLLGEPNAALTTGKQLRYGTHGSLAIDLDKNTFFDHESNEGGGILDLIQRQASLKTRKEAAQWLKDRGPKVPRVPRVTRVLRIPRVILPIRLVSRLVWPGCTMRTAISASRLSRLLT